MSSRVNPPAVMDSFNIILQQVMAKPDRAGLQMICSQVEAWESYNPRKVKDKAQRAVTAFLSDGRLAAEEDMLRLYRIMAKHSRNLGASKLFEKVEEQGRFNGSLKFHLMWAEAYAQSGDLNGFSHVLSLAKSRLPDMAVIELEAGFRDLADQYFPDCEIFNDYEETVAVFSIKNTGEPKSKKNRRRSSLAMFEARAKDTLRTNTITNTAAFGPKTRTLLRFELIDRPEDGYRAPSMEELRAAMVSDQRMDDDNLLQVPMDITMSTGHQLDVNCLHQDPPAVSHPHQVTVTDMKELGKRNRVLETVEECDSDLTNDDKRRRVLSPAAPSRTSAFASKKQTPLAELKKSDSQPTSSATFITGSSFTEKAYNDMKAMLSDTVDINKGALPGVTDETTLPISAPPVEAFEVFMDDDETQKPSILTRDENKSSHPKHFESFEPRPQIERAPFQAIPLHIAAGDSELRSGVKEPKDAVNEMNRYEDPIGFRKPFVIEDEETMAGAKFTSLGIHKKLDRGIVTSTPAHQMVHPPTHEDFFAPLNQQLAEEMKDEEDDEELYAQSAFMRRRSVAPPKSVLAATKVAVSKPRTVQAAERSMELALDKMNLGGAQEDEVKFVSDECDDHNRTGVGLVKESVTSAVNPWDRQLRMEIMKRSVVPTYQHNFDIACPRVSAGKTINFGGEDVLITTLIGQGGFAKVYKVVTDENKTLALKYEVPSCPWEVYICSEVKQRLGTSKQFTLDSVMQVTDAYVFSNASVLFNEYHPHGTLLDMANKMNDPSRYIILLIAIQMAKILRDVHAAKIIHGDVKPDNFMILNRLNENCDDVEGILSTPVLKLIDWGRAIDMRPLAGQTFSGRAGTDKFDCSEMLMERSLLQVTGSAQFRTVHGLSPTVTSPLDRMPSREELKMAERIASILKDFEGLQFEIDEEERLEVMEEEEDDWDPEEEHDDVDGQVVEDGTITFSGGAQVSEERDGRPWTYQTDYFGYVGTLHVVIFNKYAEVSNDSGIYKLQCTMKRRLSIRLVLERIFEDFLNIRDCSHFPSWDKCIEELEDQFLADFVALEWRQAVARFNQCLL